jgi:hypothetical protein
MHVRIRRLALVLAAFAAGVLLAFAGLGSARTALFPTIYVNYSMNCTFTVTNDSGGTVTSIAPGTYQIQVTTPEPFGDAYVSGSTGMTACQGEVMFQITGPGVNTGTTLDNGDDPEDSVTATFLPNSTYTMLDNNQPSVTTYVITTTASGTPVSPTTYATVPVTTKTTPVVNGAPFRGGLVITLSSAGNVSMSSGARSLLYGRYTLTISDRSSKSGLVLQRAHKAATQLTSDKFVGKHHVTVDLTVGQWLLYASTGGKRTSLSVVK